MPELPEVETIKKGLVGSIIGQTIVAVWINDVMVVRTPSPKEFIRRLTGGTIVNIKRRGKALIFVLNSGDFLVVQLAMTGQLLYGKRLPSSNVIFEFSNRQYLNYNDQRRFGRLNLTDDLDKIEFLHSLGPEPLGETFDYQWLDTQLKKHAAPIKSLMMNQNFVAGIGNIYASEILFRAQINPLKPSDQLKIEEIKKVCEKTIEVLKEAIQFRGSSIDNYRDIYGQKGNFTDRLQVYGRENRQCVNCGLPIKRIVLAGRSTFFCRRCQS